MCTFHVIFMDELSTTINLVTTTITIFEPSSKSYINLPNRQPGDGICNVCAARQAVTGVQSLARVAGQGGVTRELMHRKYVLVLGLQVVDHA
jgi:hypothetical protein